MSCIVESCHVNPYSGRDYCTRHHKAFTRWGDPLGGPGRRQSKILAWLRETIPTLDTDDCVFCPGSPENERPMITVDGVRRRAYHVAMELAGNPLPSPGMYALHSCDNGRCVNPRHLRWGTQAENVQDAVDRDRVATGFSLPHTKLSDADIESIRNAADVYRANSPKSLAARYGVTQSRIYAIQRKRG